MHEAYTLRGSLRECRMNGPAPAALVPAAAGILVTAPAPEQPEQFLVTPVPVKCGMLYTVLKFAKISYLVCVQSLLNNNNNIINNNNNNNKPTVFDML